MSYTLLTGVTANDLESIQDLWECVASLPERHMSRHIEALRKVALLLEIGADDFYEYTGGHYLYEMDEDFSEEL